MQNKTVKIIVAMLLTIVIAIGILGAFKIKNYIDTRNELIEYLDAMMEVEELHFNVNTHLDDALASSNTFLMYVGISEDTAKACDEWKSAISEIDPKTEDVVELHKIYRESSVKYRKAIALLESCCQNYDDAKADDALQLMNEYVNLYDDCIEEKDRLKEKYRIKSNVTETEGTSNEHIYYKENIQNKPSQEANTAEFEYDDTIIEDSIIKEEKDKYSISNEQENYIRNDVENIIEPVVESIGNGKYMYDGITYNNTPFVIRGIIDGTSIEIENVEIVEVDMESQYRSIKVRLKGHTIGTDLIAFSVMCLDSEGYTIDSVTFLENVKADALFNVTERLYVPEGTTELYFGN